MGYLLYPLDSAAEDRLQRFLVDVGVLHVARSLDSLLTEAAWAKLETAVRETERNAARCSIWTSREGETAVVVIFDKASLIRCGHGMELMADRMPTPFLADLICPFSRLARLMRAALVKASESCLRQDGQTR